MKLKKIIVAMLVTTLCVTSSIHVCAMDSIESTPSTVDESHKSIQSILDEYLHDDISVTPVLRDSYSPMLVSDVTDDGMTLSVSDAIYELAVDGFVPYEVLWRIGDYCSEVSDYVKVSVDNLPYAGTTYYPVAQIHYRNPQTLETNWLSISSAVTTAGTPVVETESVAITTPTVEPTATPIATIPSPVTVNKPVLSSVCYDGDMVSAEWTCDAGSYEYRITTKKGDVVKSGYSMGNKFYAYNVKHKSVLAIQVRGRIYDSASNAYTYSDWSDAMYVVKQPVAKTKSVKAKRIKCKWSNISNAKKYIVYVKKHSSSKWNRVKTTKRCSYTLKKINGKRINTKKYKYDIKIVAAASVNGMTIRSNDNRYLKV